MALYKNFVLVGLLALSVVLAHPLVRLPDGKLTAHGTNGNTQVVQRSPEPAPNGPLKLPLPVPPRYTGKSVVSEARKANNRPGREIPKLCKKLQDCSCPATAKSTSCINGVCHCDNPLINAIGNKYMESIKAVGNAAITKIMGQLWKGIATVKQVVETIAGAVLGPKARAALKVALMAIPDTGPSHIDDATKGVLSKVLG